MAGSSAGFHEAEEKLLPETMDSHRALVSLMEELEAIDWYHQRVDASSDGELREILVHNRDDEKEHASMLLEWIRRRDPAFDSELRRYLFTSSPIAEASPDAAGEGGEAPPDGSLGIGDLHGKKDI